MVWTLLIIMMISLCMVCTDDSDGLGYEVFIVDGITYESMDGYNVMATFIDTSCGLNVSLPSHIDHGGHTHTVVSIGAGFTSSMDIESLHIPATVTEIVPGALLSTSLSVITVDPSNTTFHAEGNVLYDDVGKSIVRYCPNNSDTTFEIPAGILSIYAYAFHYAINLVEISGIPSSIKVIDDFTFCGCESLVRINYAPLIGMNTLPEGLIYIGRYAFFLCDSLEQIVLPTSLVMIDSYAFAYNDSIRTIEIPSNVSYIGESVFFSCNLLESITVSPANTSYVSLDGVLFQKVNDPVELTLIHYPAMKSETSYVLPDLVNTIADSAFYGVAYLKSVTFTDKFVTIPKGALIGACSVESVTLPSTTILIDAAAFSGCTSLTTIIGGESVISIGAWAFEATKLSHPFIPKSLTSIDGNAFYDCGGFVDIMIPSTVKTLGSAVFEHCINLRTITFEGTDTTLTTESLSIGDSEFPMDVTVYYHEGLFIPSDVSNEFTNLDFVDLGEEPYPWENLIGVAVCLLVLFGMFRLFREV